jgi:poly-gamma-glutamate capsule biosynthesis protein CapA/YwtB (metallophosphatase superfamily)
MEILKMSRVVRGWGARTVAGNLLGAIFLVAVRLGGAAGSAQERTPSAAEFSLSLAGDSIIMTPASVHGSDPRFAKLRDVIRGSDAAFTNLEGTFPGRNSYPAAEFRATWIAVDPAMLKELQWIGFNLFSIANNHAMDFGIDGLLNTMEGLKSAGAVYAGVGENLAKARAPGYLSTPHGRVALIACASTFQHDAVAGQSRPDLKGRPGINPLRHETKYQVDSSTLGALQKLKDDLHLSGVAGASKSADNLSLTFEGGAPVTFAVGNPSEVVTSPNANDLAAITSSIKDAKEMADYVVVSIHSHEAGTGANPLLIPAQFVTEFAHAAIDAGADVFVGHGNHALRGIEIYKGKVILYSLGNFIFENDLVVPQPTEFYESLGLGADALPSQAFDSRSDHDRKSFPANPLLWRSVVAHVTFRDQRPAEVTLTPITLGFGKARPDRGYPVVADSKDAEEILRKLQALSQPFGTNISIQNGIGTIVLGNLRSDTASKH